MSTWLTKQPPNGQWHEMCFLKKSVSFRRGSCSGETRRAPVDVTARLNEDDPEPGALLLKLLRECKDPAVFCETVRNLDGKFNLDSKILFELANEVERRVSPREQSAASMVYRILRTCFEEFVLRDLSSESRVAWRVLLGRGQSSGGRSEAREEPMTPGADHSFEVAGITTRLSELRRMLEEVEPGLEKERLAGSLAGLMARWTLVSSFSGKEESLGHGPQP